MLIELYFERGVRMSEIPYTPLPGKIKEYFDKFQEVAVPEVKVNAEWLSILGFKGGNDWYITKILKYIGFIDSSGMATDLWRQYKDPTRSRAVLAQGIRQGYKDLFSTYPDAQRKDREALYAFFSSKTGKAKRTVDLIVNTFVNLCQLADFEKEAPPTLTLPLKGGEGLRLEKGMIPEIHINIQLHLPPTSDSTVYDSLFKSLKKNLLSAEENAS